MKKAFLIFVYFCGSIMAQNDLTRLEQKIREQFNLTEGVFALAFKDLQTGGTILINETETFHAASTMKTPVMIEIFKMAGEGKISLDDSLLVKNEFKSIVDGSPYSMDLGEDSGEELYKYIGSKRTIRQLVYDMITVSSNLATNLLVDLAGAENIMITMKEIGANNIKVLRGVEDTKAYRQNLNNTTDAYDLMVIFEKIAQNQVVSEQACGEMVQILLEQKFNDRIPALLPKEVRVAHKTGSITGIQHDSGIVYLPDGRKYVLVILAKEYNEEADPNIHAKVSKTIYQQMKEKVKSKK